MDAGLPAALRLVRARPRPIRGVAGRPEDGGARRAELRQRRLAGLHAVVGRRHGHAALARGLPHEPLAPRRRAARPERPSLRFLRGAVDLQVDPGLGRRRRARAAERRPAHGRPHALPVQWPALRTPPAGPRRPAPPRAPCVRRLRAANCRKRRCCCSFVVVVVIVVVVVVVVVVVFFFFFVFFVFFFSFFDDDGDVFEVKVVAAAVDVGAGGGRGVRGAAHDEAPLPAPRAPLLPAPPVRLLRRRGAAVPRLPHR